MSAPKPTALAAAWLLAALAGTCAPAARASDSAAEAVVAGLASDDAATRSKALAALPAVLKADPATGTKSLDALRRMLKVGGWEERAAVARLLPSIAAPEAIALWLQRLDPAKEEDERVLAAAVLATDDRAEDEALARTLIALARDAAADRLRRALAVEALGGIRVTFADAVLASPLPERNWVVESCRALALGRRGGRGAIPPLVDLLGSADAAPRVHAWEGLTRLTGQRFPAEKAPWAAWWKANEAKPSLPPPPAPSPSDPGSPYAALEPAHVPRYYGIPLPRRGDSHVVFCLDASASMYGRGIEVARRELTRTLLDLTTSHLFDVVAFNENVHPWAGRLVRAHPVVKARALAWLDRLETTSFTNLFDAVETAFGYAGKGRHPAAVPVRLDAVFLLSDGRPNRGRYLAEGPLVAAIAALSERRVPVHTVGAGDEVFPLLRAIATATGGTFVDGFE